MMKKTKDIISATIVPAAVFAVVWYVSSHVLRYTMLMQEQKGIFLNTPDYYRQVFSDSWPITTLISDFLVQMYASAGLGAIVTAAIVTLVYLCAIMVFRFLPFRKLIGGVVAAGTWIAIAHANTPRTGVAILMISAVLALIAALLPLKKHESETSGKVAKGILGKAAKIQDAGAIAISIIAAALIITDGKIRDYERWNAVDYTSRCRDWNVVLAIASPQQCKQDMSYVPYAMLALNASGQLGEKIFDYPVTGPESLGETNDDSWSAYSLRSLIYETIGCPNEAIHQTYQLGMKLPHGTSLGLLRQLMRLEIENGDYELAIKHADILARSPFNKKTAAAAKKMAMDSAKAANNADDEGRETDTMISNSPIYNLSGILMNCEGANSAAADRLLAHLLIEGNVESFRKTLSEFYGNVDQNRLPKYFRQGTRD